MCDVLVYFNLWMMVVFADDQEILDEEMLLHTRDDWDKISLFLGVLTETDVHVTHSLSKDGQSHQLLRKVHSRWEF